MNRKNYKYIYQVVQSGKGRIELFGRDTIMTNVELEQMRRRLNDDHFPAYVSALSLKNMRTDCVIASSARSGLAPAPLFVIQESAA